MSNSQQQGGQSRQPVNYPSPTSYPSPNMSSAQQYNYPAPNNQQVNEPYRASPTGSNGSLSLPSMRSLDPLQQQAQQHLSSPFQPPVVPAGGPYYHSNQTLPHPQHQYPNVTSDPTNANMRYALPQPDQRVMSGGRHKKEIKRRTKTGCLTCRKRRIKCDEQHPACRNCEKSKRECLGYDPIFKQQPGPAPIQPAPSSGPSHPSTSAPSNPYGNQPSMYGAPNMGYEPALSAGVSSPGSASHQFDYSSAIDPALEAVAPPTANSANQFQQSPSGMPNFREDLKRELQSASPYSSGASDSPHLRGGALSPLSQSSSHFSPSEEHSSAYASSAKRIKMEDLLNLGGSLPPPLPVTSHPSNSPDMIEEIKHLYHSIYSPGLESFLESKWFAVKGVGRLLGDNQLLEQFAILLDQFGATSAGEDQKMLYVQGVEARVVWALASMVRAAGQESNGSKAEGGIPASDDAAEAGHRLTVFENLITGVVADRNPLAPARDGAGDHHRLRELNFWYHLAEFTTVAGTATGVDNTLLALRNLLDGRENRDVLYSIAVVRALSNRVAEYSAHEKPLHLDESDPRSKLAVAKQLIKTEAEGAGTTNVIRRLCELVVRSWPATPA